MSRVSGVYTITCTANGRKYVGSSSHVRSRWNTHKSLLRNGRHPTVALQADWDEHGESAFEFRVVLQVADPELRLDAEEAAIARYQAVECGYNESPSSRDCTGRVMPPEQRAAISEAHKGRPKSAEHRARLGEVQKALWADRELTPEISQRMADMARSRAGTPMSEEHKRKISEAQKGRPKSPEHAAALRAAGFGTGKPLKLTAEQIPEIRRRLAAGESMPSIAAAFGVKPASISDIKHGRSWRHIT